MRVHLGLGLAVLLGVVACSGGKTDPQKGVPDGGPGNSAPTLAALAAVTVSEGASQSVSLVATDPDGDPLQFSLVSPPAFVTVSGATLTVAPGFSDAGDYTVTVHVSDGAHGVEGSFALTVTNVNRPPVLQPVSDVSMLSGATLQLQLQASDPDGDPVSLTLSAAPAFAHLTGSQLTLAPEASDVGTHPLILTASDGSASTSQTVSVTVSATNAVPVVSGLGQTDSSGTAVSPGSVAFSAPGLQAAFTDGDGDSVQLQAEVVLASAAFAGTVTHSTALSASSPQTIDLGTLPPGAYKWQVRAKDSRGGTSAWVAYNNGGTAFTVGAGTIQGSISILGGKAATNQTTVTLNLSAQSTAGAVTQMHFSNDGATWTSFEPYATTKSGYALATPGTDGVKTLWVEFQDAAGNVATASDTIVLDTVPPAAPGIDYRGGSHVSNVDPVPFTMTTAEPSTDGLELGYLVSDGVDTNFNPMGSLSWVPFSATLTTSGQWGQHHSLYAALRDAAGNTSGLTRYEMVLDTVRPTVSSVSPGFGETGVPVTSPISVTFSEAIDPASVNATNLSVTGASGHWEFNGTATRATYVLDAPMGVGVNVVVTVQDVTDLAGNALAAPYSDNFTTGDRTLLTSAAVPLSGKTLRATNPAGTMVLIPHGDGGANPSNSAADLTWAFWNGQGWTGGSLGNGATLGSDGVSDAKLIAWGNKFVAVWGSRWAIFDQGAWTYPSAPSPRGDFAANSLGLMQTWLGTVTYYDYHFNSYVTDYRVNVQRFDGSAWGPVVAAADRVGPTFLSYADPRIAASADDFAVMYETNELVAYDTVQYAAVVIRYDQGAWSGGTRLIKGGYSSSVGALLGNADGFAAYLPGNGQSSVYSSASGTWTQPTGLSSTLVATDGQGFAAAANDGSVRIFANGTWGAATPMSGKPELLVGDAGRYLVVHRDDATATLTARIYEGGAWSEPYSSPAAASAQGITASDATFSGADAAVAYVADGSANVLLRQGGAWTVQSGLQSDAATTGGLAVVDAAGAVSALFGNGRDCVQRTWAGTAFGGPTTVSTTTFQTDARNPQIAFLSNGHGLATWEQSDRGIFKVFAAEFDGTQWGAATAVSGLPADSTRIAVNGTQFEVLFRSEPETGGCGVYAVPFVPGTGVGAVAELVSPASSDASDVAVRLASDGSGFLAVFGERSSGATQSSAMVSTSADGVTWTSPATLETTVDASYEQPAVVGNPLGYLIATPTSSTARSVRLYSGGSLGAATVYGNDVFLAANPTSFAVAQLYSSSVGIQIYSAGAWAPEATVGGGRPTAFVGGDAGFRIAFGNTTSVWEGTSWSYPQTIGADLSAMVPRGSEYAGIATQWSGEPLAFKSNGSTLEAASAPNLPGVSGSITLGAGTTSYWALGLATDPAFGTRQVEVGGF